MKTEIPVPPLDQVAAIPRLRGLLSAGAISVEESDAMESRVRRELPWRPWLDRGLLSLGIALILVGVGYFFAHNWGRLTDADKLGLAGGAVLLALAVGTWIGFERFPGKLLLLAASALVGVFLAVFGQVYQTGANDYELFTGWALLIFPWVILGRLMPLWIFWVALLNMAIGLYWPVAYLFDKPIVRVETLSLVALNGIALLGREAVAGRRWSWIDGGWSRFILLAAILTPATFGTIAEVLDTWSSGHSATTVIIAGLLFAAIAAGLGYYYCRVAYSLPSLALVVLSVCTVLTFILLRVLFNANNPDAGIFLLGGIVVLAIFGAGVWFLRTQRLQHQEKL